MRKFIGIVFIIIGVPLFLIGLLILISPTGFLWVVSHLPENIQLAVFGDILFGATPRSWAYLIGGGLLLWFGFWLKGR
jgi:hypothetical protein